MTVSDGPGRTVHSRGYESLTHKVRFLPAVPIGSVLALDTQNPRYLEVGESEPAWTTGNSPELRCKSLHLKSEICQPSICERRFYGSPFSGLMSV
jgi:hypothetical protein